MTIILDELLAPTAIKYKEERLDFLKDLAQQLGVDSWQIPVISVTGTNGKGSTVVALRDIYQHAGYKVGTFTSPHLLRVNERIAVNGAVISDPDLNELANHLRATIDIFSLSWFEALFLMALVYFKTQQLDVMILEVGMGGRLDAINILDANLVIITNVELDHQAYLGTTREAIAFEKAGLFRQQQAAIFADNNCPQSVKQHCSGSLKLFGEDYNFSLQEDGWSLYFAGQAIHLPLPKVHVAAMSAAIYASYILIERLPVTRSCWFRANETVFIPGRFQEIDNVVAAKIILDVGHNPHAAELLYSRLPKITGKIHCIFSVLKDKEKREMIKIMSKAPLLWYPCVLNVERASSADEMLQLFFGITDVIYSSPQEAFSYIESIAAHDDCIVVFGSFYIVEAIIRILIERGYNVF